MKPANYLILLFLPALIIAGYYLGGWFNFLVPLCSFFAYPVANFFLSSSEKHAHQQIHSSSAYKKIALLFVPVLFFITAWCVYKSATIKMNTVSYFGLAISLGVANSIIGFTLAHEFIHRYGKAEKFAGYF